MPTTTNEVDPPTTDCPRTPNPLSKGAHQHNAPTKVCGTLIPSPSQIRALGLGRMVRPCQRNRPHSRQIHFRGPHLSLGIPSGACYGQRHTIHRSSRNPPVPVWDSSCPYLGVQLESERDCQMPTLTCPQSPHEDVRRPAFEMDDTRSCCVLG